MSWTPERVLQYAATGRMGQVPLPVIQTMQQRGLRNIARAAMAPVDHEVRRTCGDCRACCSALGIEDSPGEREHGLVHTWSAPGESCPHECERGCAVYERRPLSCRGYACWWLRGWGAEHDRPDRLGLIVDNAISAPMLAQVAPMPICIVSETRVGVFPSKAAPVDQLPEIVLRLAKSHVVLLRWWGDMNPTQVIGPEHLMEKVRAVDEAWRQRHG